MAFGINPSSLPSCIGLQTLKELNAKAQDLIFSCTFADIYND